MLQWLSHNTELDAVSTTCTFIHFMDTFRLNSLIFSHKHARNNGLWPVLILYVNSIFLGSYLEACLLCCILTCAGSEVSVLADLLFCPPPPLSPWAAKTRLRWTQQIWRTWRKWKRRRREKMKTAKVGVSTEMLHGVNGSVLRIKIFFNSHNKKESASGEACKVECQNLDCGTTVDSFTSWKTEVCTLFKLSRVICMTWFWIAVKSWEALICFILGSACC